MGQRGRKVKYSDRVEYKNVRRIQNRDNQRNTRSRKKVEKDIVKYNLTPKEIDNRYQKEIIKYGMGYEFNTYFTGTIDLKRVQKEEIRMYNREVQKFNEENGTNFDYIIKNYGSIESLRRYTIKNIEFLMGKKYLDRCMLFFETGLNDNVHTHILINSKVDKSVIGLILEICWLMGLSKVSKPIENEEDKFKVLRYSVKELKPSSTNDKVLRKVDNWCLIGNYNRRKHNLVN
jgi:hypothetical protein